MVEEVETPIMVLHAQVIGVDETYCRVEQCSLSNCRRVIVPPWLSLRGVRVREGTWVVAVNDSILDARE